MWPGRYFTSGLMHMVITPSPHSTHASTECGLYYQWKGGPVYDGPPTCLECWRLYLRRGK